MIKTNVMRILEENKISYKAYEYEVDEKHLDAVHAANYLNEDINRVYKTIVTTYNKEYFVCVMDALGEIDLKKAAKAFGVKSLEMLPVNDLLKVTGGYIRGGCSPIGMKKLYKTIIDENAQLYDTIIYSAGKRGVQVETSPFDLANLIDAKFFDIRMER